MDKLKRAVIREELVALTGDFRQAILLNQFIYWSERVNDFNKFIDEEKERVSDFKNPHVSKNLSENLLTGWIWKTADKLAEECMLYTLNSKGKSELLNKSTISRALKGIVDNGWLVRRRNPKDKRDRTYQYRVDLVKIAKDLLKKEYFLQDYEVPLEIILDYTKLREDIDNENNNDDNTGESIGIFQVANCNLQDSKCNLQDSKCNLQNADCNNDVAINNLQDSNNNLDVANNDTKLNNATTLLENTLEIPLKIPLENSSKSVLESPINQSIYRKEWMDRFDGFDNYYRYIINFDKLNEPQIFEAIIFNCHLEEVEDERYRNALYKAIRDMYFQTKPNFGGVELPQYMVRELLKKLTDDIILFALDKVENYLVSTPITKTSKYLQTTIYNLIDNMDFDILAQVKYDMEQENYRRAMANMKKEDNNSVGKVETATESDNSVGNNNEESNGKMDCEGLTGESILETYKQTEFFEGLQGIKANLTPTSFMCFFESINSLRKEENSLIINIDNDFVRGILETNRYNSTILDNFKYLGIDTISFEE